MKNIALLFVVCVSFLTAIWLWEKTYFISPWPTDSWTLYIPAAKDLANLDFISDLHTFNQNRSLHNKEILILGIALFQKILNDYDTIFPNIALLIVCFFFSSLLLLLIFSKWFDRKTGLLASFIFLTSFWSYLYILQGAHQPLVLVNLLFAVYFLTITRTKIIQYLISGFFVGMMLFSSPTAPLFLIYYLAAFIYIFFYQGKKSSKIKLTTAALLIIGGILLIIIPLTLPDPIDTIKRYFNFVDSLRHNNDFVKPQFYYSDNFIQYSKRGAGISWILKYFLTTMPAYFLFYILCLLYLIRKSLRHPLLIPIICLSLSTPIGVEISQSAQFGRNYYSWHLGMILIICITFYYFRKNIPYHFSARSIKLTGLLFLVFLINNTFLNMKTLTSDVIPSRLFANDIYYWLKAHPDKSKFIYRYNLYNTFAGERKVNNPKFSSKIDFQSVNTLKDAKDGLFLIPPISGNNIYTNCQGADFNLDPYLSELLKSGQFKKFVVAEFPTIGSSDIWNQEEEYCTYVDLHLGRMTADDKFKSHAYILDAGKLQHEWFGKGFGNYEVTIIFNDK